MAESTASFLSSLPALLGAASVSVLVAGWLVASLSGDVGTRSRAAWLGATALFLALATLFFGLVRSAWQEDHIALLVPFGFLLVLFSSGFLVGCFKTVGEFRSKRAAGAHATH